MSASTSHRRILASIAVSLACALAGCNPAPPSFQTVADHSSCLGAAGYTAAPGGRRTFLWRADWLRGAKLAASSGDPRVVTLLEQADTVLKRPVYSVVDKTSTPPGGTKHDYMSLGTYWWPNPKSKDGTPYIRDDGRPNPEKDTDKYDLNRLSLMSNDVETLSLAYYLTDDPRYAMRAAHLVRTWFLNPATRMNPNLQFAQSVPGVSTGRGTGIIDTVRLTRVVEAVGLIEPSGDLSPAELTALKAWFSDYLRWMTTSENGKSERDSDNNHGSWYDQQILSFALFVGDVDLAEKTAKKAAKVRIVEQIEKDGSLPHEIARTRSFFYSMYGTQALMDVATLSECVGQDLWNFKSLDGRSLRKSVDMLARYAGDEKSWPHPETLVEHDRLYDVLARAAWAYDDDALVGKARVKWRFVSQEPESLLTPRYAPPAKEPT